MIYFLDISSIEPVINSRVMRDVTAIMSPSVGVFPDLQCGHTEPFRKAIGLKPKTKIEGDPLDSGFITDDNDFYYYINYDNTRVFNYFSKDEKFRYYGYGVDDANLGENSKYIYYPSVMFANTPGDNYISREHPDFIVTVDLFFMFKDEDGIERQTFFRQNYLPEYRYISLEEVLSMFDSPEKPLRRLYDAEMDKNSNLPSLPNLYCGSKQDNIYIVGGGQYEPIILNVRKK